MVNDKRGQKGDVRLVSQETHNGKMVIKMLKARNGDCFTISLYQKCGKKYNIVIDGGPASAFEGNLRRELLALSREKIDLLVLTHTDDDHIGGLLKLFGSNGMDECKVQRVLYNSPEILAREFGTEHDPARELKFYEDGRDHSQAQAKSFDILLKEKGILNAEVIHDRMEAFYVGEAKIVVLSPSICQLEKLNREWVHERYADRDHAAAGNDYGISIEELQNVPETIKTSSVNESSIAFLIEFEDKRVLFLGDSSPQVIVSSLKRMGYSSENKISVDYVKLSHHGSKHSTSYELLELVDCSRFLISTNGMRHCHPDKETLAKILKENQADRCVEFYFNYTNSHIFSKYEVDRYFFQCTTQEEFIL